jgi:hypothetical protein
MQSWVDGLRRFIYIVKHSSRPLHRRDLKPGSTYGRRRVWAVELAHLLLFRRRGFGVICGYPQNGQTRELFKVCCAQDLEGIVIKAARGPYSETPRSWLKVLNPDYTQKRGRREMFEKFHGSAGFHNLKSTGAVMP